MTDVTSPIASGTLQSDLLTFFFPSYGMLSTLQHFCSSSSSLLSLAFSMVPRFSFFFSPTEPSALPLSDYTVPNGSDVHPSTQPLVWAGMSQNACPTLAPWAGLVQKWAGNIIQASESGLWFLLELPERKCSPYRETWLLKLCKPGLLRTSTAIK